MSNLAGIGRVNVVTTINGLTADDWQHLDKVVPLVQSPSGEVLEQAVEVDINSADQTVTFIHEFADEGEYTIGFRCEFDDDTWSTTYRNASVIITDAFGGQS